MSPRLAIVVPVYREHDAIGPCLDHLSRCEDIDKCEVVIVDGDNGSTHPPYGLLPIRVIRSVAGRGVQLNAGARESVAPALIFLHVDTALPKNFVGKVLAALERSPAGAFDLHIVTGNPITALISLVGRIRSRITRIPYGDQAHFIRRTAFEDAGGYPEEPIMEDVGLMDRLKERQHRIVFLTPASRTSDRRWRAEGAIRCTLRNWKLMAAYRAGTKPEDLVRRYPPRPLPPRVRAGAGRIWHPHRVILFYRAIRPGGAKTRLAAESGDRAALEIYRSMLEDLVSALGDLGSPIIPYIDDHDVGIDPLGGGRAQTGDSLEARMDNAFADVFAAGAETAVLIGSDIPGLDRGHLRDAAAALQSSDAVIAPCFNGGYHLIGFGREKYTPVFAGREDSTVQDHRAETDPYHRILAALEAAGLSVTVLPARRDIDTASDLADLYRLDPCEHPALDAAVTLHAPHLMRSEGD